MFTGSAVKRCLLLLGVCLPLQAVAAGLSGQPITFKGEIENATELSAAAFMHGLLVIAADEADADGANTIQWLRPDGAGRYKLVRSDVVYRGDSSRGSEMDIEGLAADADRLYVIGSHSLARKRMKSKFDDAENRQRMFKIKDEESRRLLYRLDIAADGSIRKSRSVSLGPLLRRDPLLARFAEIPGKENGIDIEAIAVRDGILYAGFRGPVLRDGYVPVMRFHFDSPEKYQLRFLPLGGRGIRDMVAISDGFLLLAGPVGDEPVSFQLWYWSGDDCLPGQGRNLSACAGLIGELSPPVGGKPEAVTVMAESAHELELLILHDGIAGGAPRRYTIAPPGSLARVAAHE